MQGWTRAAPGKEASASGSTFANCKSGGGQEQAARRSAGETVATPHRQAYRRAYEQLSAQSSKPMSTTGRTCPQRVQLPACRLTCDCACFETCAPPEPSRQSQSPAGPARPPASRRCRRVLLVASALVFNVVDGLSDEAVDGGRRRRRGYIDLERAVDRRVDRACRWDLDEFVRDVGEASRPRDRSSSANRVRARAFARRARAVRAGSACRRPPPASSDSCPPGASHVSPPSRSRRA